MHHLGKCYAADGDYQNAIFLLERSMAEYEQLQLPAGHCCVTDAQCCLREFLEKQLSVGPSTGSQRLKIIREEDDEESNVW